MQENSYNVPTMHKHVIREHRVQLTASFKITSVHGGHIVYNEIS